MLVFNFNYSCFTHIAMKQIQVQKNDKPVQHCENYAWYMCFGKSVLMLLLTMTLVSKDTHNDNSITMIIEFGLML